MELVRLLLATSATATADRRNQQAKGRERTDELAASLIDVFIPRYVRHFRLFIPPMVFGCLCSIFIASLYFVQPQRLISTIALFSVAVTVAVAFLWYLALYLDPVISAVAGSKSGKLTSRLALARTFLLWSAIPVAGYLAVEHPEFPLWVSNLLDFVGKSLR